MDGGAYGLETLEQRTCFYLSGQRDQVRTLLLVQQGMANYVHSIGNVSSASNASVLRNGSSPSVTSSTDLPLNSRTPVAASTEGYNRHSQLHSVHQYYQEQSHALSAREVDKQEIEEAVQVCVHLIDNPPTDIRFVCSVSHCHFNTFWLQTKNHKASHPRISTPGIL